MILRQKSYVSHLDIHMDYYTCFIKYRFMARVDRGFSMTCTCKLHKLNSKTWISYFVLLSKVFKCSDSNYTLLVCLE